MRNIISSFICASSLAVRPHAMGVSATPPPDLDVSIDTVTGRCSYRVTDRALLECRHHDGRMRWRYAASRPWQGAHSRVIMRADRTRLYIAHCGTASPGSTIEAYELRTGDRLWPKTTLGPFTQPWSGPYFNRVDFTLSHGLLRVDGHESRGTYVESLTAATGQSPTKTWGERPTFNLYPSQPPAPTVPAAGVTPDLRYAFVGNTARAPRTNLRVTNSVGVQCIYRQRHVSTTVCVDQRGRELWRIDIASERSGALAITDRAFFVARYHRESPGVTLSAYEVYSGYELWTAHLHGAGSVPPTHPARSKWTQNVELRVALVPAVRPPSTEHNLDFETVRDNDLIVVSGWTAHGNYVEAVDATTGAHRGVRSAP